MWLNWLKFYANVIKALMWSYEFYQTVIYCIYFTAIKNNNIFTNYAHTWRGFLKDEPLNISLCENWLKKKLLKVGR